VALPVAIMGRSLGTAVAVRVAREVRPAALVLVSPLCSVEALLRANPLLAPKVCVETPDGCAGPRTHVECPAPVLMAKRDRRVPNPPQPAAAANSGGPVTVRTLTGVVHRTLPRSVGVQETRGQLERELGGRP